MSRYVIAPLKDFETRDRMIVTVAGRSIGVFRIDGEFFAVRNQCPHAGGPLCQGELGGIVRSSQPGEFDYARRGEFLRCPWHSWEFDLRTGRSWFDPDRVRVRAYEAAVLAGGEVIGCGVKEIEHEARQPGPYTVETYPIRVEDAYVVVDV
ncbi:Rieske (2Fe-2S) protein [Aquabacter spiritensis]|uniref:3-phenylpropionate/trans-cinnamate dioxygenase ferredoxin subunit n=1 Tax=Aquabacter spiritensis TaxID=933073 RepID=A0A4R3LTT2_9HYPH|nr:Rieske (2Fe-2S) protein [Aquabacter spiritensis]TCT03861.1 3-phenylpropionate/trans-cinnamate dioxygenase ferredoxin subunit [Aquabacter spiritensis]